jgi:hypothetical protein
MKFSQLTLGETFLFKDVEYTKTGPLQAIDNETGTERMIMRAASVELPKSKINHEALAQNPLALKLAIAESLITEYHQTCLSYLDGANHEQKRMQANVLYQKIETALNDIKKQWL